jgi:hypothetical protein
MDLQIPASIDQRVGLVPEFPETSQTRQHAPCSIFRYFDNYQVLTHESRRDIPLRPPAYENTVLPTNVFSSSL